MTTPPNPPEDPGGWPGGGQNPPPSGGGYGEQPPGGGYGGQSPGGGYGPPPSGGGYGEQPPGGGYGQPPGGGYGAPPPGGGYGAPPPYGQPSSQNNTPTIMGIIGIVCWFCCSPAAIVLGLIGQSQAKKSGQSATLPMIAWIGGIVFLLLGILYWIFVGTTSFSTNSSGY